MSNYNNTIVLLDGCEAIRASAARKIDSSLNRIAIILRNCHLDVAAAAMVIRIFRQNQNIVKEVVLNKCTGHLNAILTVALACTEMDSLSIFIESSNSTVLDPLVHSIGVGLLTNLSLQNLLLSTGSNCAYFTLTSSAAKSLEHGMSGNTSLSHLRIENCRFAERSALRILSRGMQRMGSLREVRLASCYEPNGQPLEDQSIAQLIRAVECNPDIEHLDLSQNKCLDMGMVALASLLDKTRIRTLNISSQKMDRTEFMNTYPLVGALARTLTLHSLQLRSNNLSSDYDMANLAAALTHNNSIKCIDLTDNNIRCSAMNILSSRIPSMKALEVLLIDENENFDHKTSEMLAKGMQENTMIRTIHCDRNLLDYKLIRYYADLNWGGRKFLSQRTSESENRSGVVASIPLPLWPKVLSRIGSLSESYERQASAIYFFLQHSTVMFQM